MTSESQITFYTCGSPNGYKVAHTLEELGLKYEFKTLDLSANEQKSDWFLAINPNGRVPALTDVLPGGKPIRLFESGSIMQYLIARYDPHHKISYPEGTDEYYQTNNWLFWQMGGIGPMQGQWFHFSFYANSTVPQDYALNRYGNETRRLYRTVDTHLATTGMPFLVGDKPTIADFALWPWMDVRGLVSLNISEFTHLAAWFERIAARPATRRALNVPPKVNLVKIQQEKPEEFRKMMDVNKAWIQRGMQDGGR